MRFRFRLLAVPALAAIVAGACATGGARNHGRVIIDLRDSRSGVSQRLDDNLALVVTSLGRTGWELEVRDKRSPRSDNLLYHSLEWHGPYPNQVFAWHVVRRYFPDERWLCVYRYRPQYELRAHLLNVATIGSGDQATFERGTLVVEWWRRRCRGS